MDHLAATGSPSEEIVTPASESAASCDCIKKFNAHLKEHNTEINVPFWTRSGILAPFIETRKLDDKKRGKPKAVIASCCPFCGVKYAKASAERGDRTQGTSEIGG